MVYLCINNYEVLSQYRELFLLLRMHRSMITLHVTMPKFTLNHAEPKSDNWQWFSRVRTSGTPYHLHSQSALHYQYLKRKWKLSCLQIYFESYLGHWNITNWLWTDDDQTLYYLGFFLIGCFSDYFFHIKCIVFNLHDFVVQFIIMLSLLTVTVHEWLNYLFIPFYPDQSMI